jgi:hypothetical protein
MAMWDLKEKGKMLSPGEILGYPTDGDPRDIERWYLRRDMSSLNPGPGLNAQKPNKSAGLPNKINGKLHYELCTRVRFPGRCLGLLESGNIFPLHDCQINMFFVKYGPLPTSYRYATNQPGPGASSFIFLYSSKVL